MRDTRMGDNRAMSIGLKCDVGLMLGRFECEIGVMTAVVLE